MDSQGHMRSEAVQDKEEKKVWCTYVAWAVHIEQKHHLQGSLDEVQFRRSHYRVYLRC